MAPNAPHFDDPLSLSLDVIGPKPNTTRGEPVESGKVLFADAHSESGVWECSAGAFAARREGYRETFAVVRGRGVLRNEDGTETALAPGVVVVTPEGWIGEWDIAETIRKIYVVSYTEPRTS